MDTTEKVKSRWTRSFFTGLNTRGDEERDICDICHKDFASPSNLSLHRSTHVIERRYKCEPCQVSFHSQGHLQKHKRSSAHETRVEMTQAFGVPTSDNPRPYGCPECDTAFRKHGHLAKHLRSKSHITKLEANGLIPTGTFAILDKCGPELKEKLVTTNCELSLISLRKIAMQLFADRPEMAAMGGSPERRMMLSPGSTRLIHMGSNASPPSLMGAAGTSVDLSSNSCHTSSADDSSMSASGHHQADLMAPHYAPQPSLDYPGPLAMSLGQGPLQQQPLQQPMNMIDSHGGAMSSGLPPPPPPPHQQHQHQHQQQQQQHQQLTTSINSHRNPYELDFTLAGGGGGGPPAAYVANPATRPSIIHGSHPPSNTSQMIVHSPGVLRSPPVPVPPPLDITQQVPTSASNFLSSHHSQPPQPPLHHHHQQQQQQQQFHQSHHIQQRAPPVPLQQTQHFVSAGSASMPIGSSSSSSPAAGYHSASNNNLQYRPTGGPFKMAPISAPPPPQHFSHGNQAAAMQQPDVL